MPENKRKIAELENAIELLKRQLERSDENLKSTSEELCSCLRENQAWKKENTELKFSNSAIVAENVGLTEQLDKAKFDNAKQEPLLNAAEILRRCGYPDDAAKCVAAYSEETLRHNLETHLRRCRAKIIALEQQVKVLLSDHTLIEDLNDCKKQIIALKYRLSNQGTNLRVRSQTCERLREEIDKLKQRLASSMDVLRDYQNRITELKQDSDKCEEIRLIANRPT